MIRAFVFDLDGTLVETEELKALSYARAAVELHPAGDEEEGDEDTEADGLELCMEARMRHHLVAIQ